MIGESEDTPKRGVGLWRPTERNPDVPTQITSGHSTLDPVRSTVGFHRKTFWGLTAVNDVFGSVQGRGIAEGGLVNDVASLDSKHTKRDNHLRSKEMLDAEAFPKITFDAERSTPTGSSTADVEARSSPFAGPAGG